MSDTPPPLPIAEAPPVLTAEAARMAPPPAPMLWRTLAFLADYAVVGLVGYLITTRYLVPHFKPEELEVFNGWLAESDKAFHAVLDAAQRAAESGSTAAYEKSLESFAGQLKEMPKGAQDIILFSSTCMTMIYWVGFSAMEIAMRGGSLGKTMFRLRVATFPYCERPRVFDSLVRSGWKAMCVGSISPLMMLFAVVDAHWPLFNPLRRSLHDLMARTLVIDARFEPEEEKKDEDDADEE